jgi:hypothetical protein
VDRQQIAGVVTVAGTVRVKSPEGVHSYLRLARATDPLRRPFPSVWWNLEDLWFGIGVVLPRIWRVVRRDRRWRVEVSPSLRERPTALAVGRDRSQAAELAAAHIVDAGYRIDP